MNPETSAALRSGKYLNSPPVQTGDSPGPERTPDGGILARAKVVLDRARLLLAAPELPQLERSRVLHYAVGGPDRKADMLLAMGQAYDAAVKAYDTEVGALTEMIRSAAGAGLMQEVAAETSGLDAVLARTPREREIKRPVVRYTWMSVGLTLASLILLGLGINTTGTILMGSGIPGLDQPWRAYLFSFVPAGLALGLAGLYRLLSPSQQVNYARAVWGVGIAFGTLWVLLFSRCFAGFAQSATTVIQNILSESNPGGAPSLAGPALIACGVLAEVFLGAGCSISAQRSFVVVEIGATEPNPEFPRLVARRDELTKLQGEFATVLGQFASRVGRLADNRKDFLNKASEFFDLSVSEHFTGCL